MGFVGLSNGPVHLDVSVRVELRRTVSPDIKT